MCYCKFLTPCRSSELQITTKAGGTAMVAVKQVPLDLPISVVSDSRITLLAALVNQQALQEVVSLAPRLQHQRHSATTKTVDLVPLILAAASSGRSLEGFLERLLLPGRLVGSLARPTIPLVVLGLEARAAASALAVEVSSDKITISNNNPSLSPSVPPLLLLVEDLAQVVPVLAARTAIQILGEVFSGLVPRRIAAPSVNRTMLRPTHRPRIHLVASGSQIKLKTKVLPPIPLVVLASRIPKNKNPADSSEMHHQAPTPAADCSELRTIHRLAVACLASRITTSPLVTRSSGRSQLREEASSGKPIQRMPILVEVYLEASERIMPIKIRLSKIKEVVCLLTTLTTISRSQAASSVAQRRALVVASSAIILITTTSSLEGASSI